MTGLPVCRKCGTALSSDNWYPSHQKVNSRICKGCERKEHRSRYNNNRDTNKINRERWYALFCNARFRARKKGIPFSLTEVWIKERLAAGICEVTGLPFISPNKPQLDPLSPSIDQIEPSAGYTPENCRMVVWLFNIAKGPFRDEDVMTMARALVQRT